MSQAIPHFGIIGALPALSRNMATLNCAVENVPGKFTHISERDSRAADLTTSICAVLLAEACNTGTEPLLNNEIPSLRRARFSWVNQDFIRNETLTEANACLVAAQNRIPLVQAWGGGEVASHGGSSSPLLSNCRK